MYHSGKQAPDSTFRDMLPASNLEFVYISQKTIKSITLEMKYRVFVLSLGWKGLCSVYIPIPNNPPKSNPLLLLMLV